MQKIKSSTKKRSILHEFLSSDVTGVEVTVHPKHIVLHQKLLALTHSYARKLFHYSAAFPSVIGWMLESSFSPSPIELTQVKSEP